jgi:hypothetical protein
VTGGFVDLLTDQELFHVVGVVDAPAELGRGVEVVDPDLANEPGPLVDFARVPYSHTRPFASRYLFTISTAASQSKSWLIGDGWIRCVAVVVPTHTASTGRTAGTARRGLAFAGHTAAPGTAA